MTVNNTGAWLQKNRTLNLNECRERKFGFILCFLAWVQYEGDTNNRVDIGCAQRGSQSDLMNHVS